MNPKEIITKAFSSEINNQVINKLFPNLNMSHKSVLLVMLTQLLTIIMIKFAFNPAMKTKYEDQFRNNDYQDVKGLLLLLLPYINGDFTKIKDLNELYVTRQPSSLDTNITKSSPDYLYTNLQYNRCNRDPIKEVNFKLNHLEQNYFLLFETIKLISNKLDG